MESYRLQALELWKTWQALSPPRKVAWSAGVLGCVALAGLLWWASQPEYRVLYTGLSAEEAGAITAKLQAKGVPYRLAGGGSTILVSVDQSMQAHLDLTAEGVAGSSKVGKGFDLFDQPMLSATPFNQHVNFLRAQQSELAKTIMQIDPIILARVHIVRPEPSPFLRDQKPTTAGVTLKLKPGATLNRNTINGIAALVAGSVEGLTRDNVRIIDANGGRLLSEERDPDSGAAGSMVDQRRDLEHHLAKEAETMLEVALGVGKAVVTVRTDLNTKVMKERKETINPEGRVAKSEKTATTKTSPGGSAKGGAAGTSPNLGKSAANVAPGSGGTSTTETQQSEFDYPRTVVETQNKQGAIERLTVAAFVDSAALTSHEPPLSLDQIKETIKMAVGFKVDRDEIQVTAVHMPAAHTESGDEDYASQARLQMILTSVRNISIAVVALCILPIIWVVFRRFRSAAPAPETLKLQNVTQELDRNPEAIAKILSVWMTAAETSDRKAA